MNSPPWNLSLVLSCSTEQDGKQPLWSFWLVQHPDTGCTLLYVPLPAPVTVTFFIPLTHTPFLTQGIDLLVAAGHVLAEGPNIASQVLRVIVLGDVCGGLATPAWPLLAPAAGVSGLKCAVFSLLVCPPPVVHTGCAGLGEPPFVNIIQHRTSVAIAF